MKLDDLYRILSNQSGFSFYEFEEAMKQAAEIICLVDDWATARKKLDIFEDDESSEQFCNAVQALYAAAKGE